MELNCPNCKLVGDVDCPQGFHPDDVFCGCCEKIFPYTPSVWEILGENQEGGLGVVHLRPRSLPRPTAPVEPVQEQSNADFLDTFPLRMVLKTYQVRCRPRGSYYDHGTLNLGGRLIPICEIKAYLAEVPTLKQGKMPRGSLVQVAQRGGWVQWFPSEIVERLCFEEGEVFAGRPGFRDTKHLISGGDHKVYNCREVPR